MAEKLKLVAIDGGGTKTEFLLFDIEGHIQKRLVLEGCNPNICGIDRTKEILFSGTVELTEGNIPQALFCGMAGALTGNSAQLMTGFLEEKFPAAKVLCRSDIFNVAASGSDKEDCIAAICGTGSNVSVIKGDKVHRIGGWGYLFDGTGSGYDMGREAIRATLAANDGMRDKSPLTELAEKKLGGNIWDNIGRLYSEDKAFIASFAEEVFMAAELGDKAALDIIRENAEGLADRINFAAGKHGIFGDLVLSGGIVSHSRMFRDILYSKLDKKLHPVIPGLPPVFGACLLCGELMGADREKMKVNLKSDYERLTHHA